MGVGGAQDPQGHPRGRGCPLSRAGLFLFKQKYPTEGGGLCQTLGLPDPEPGAPQTLLRHLGARETRPLAGCDAAGFRPGGGSRVTLLPARERGLGGNFPPFIPTDPRSARGRCRARSHPTPGIRAGQVEGARSPAPPPARSPAPPLPDGAVGARAHRAQPLQPLRHLPHRLVQLLPVEAGARAGHVLPRPPPRRSARSAVRGAGPARGFPGTRRLPGAAEQKPALLAPPGAVPGRMGFAGGRGSPVRLTAPPASTSRGPRTSPAMRPRSVPARAPQR